MTLDLTLKEDDIVSRMQDFHEYDVVSEPVRPTGKLDVTNASRFIETYKMKMRDLPANIDQLYILIKRDVGGAIENAVSHGGNIVKANVKYDLSSLLITVEDNGPGFDAEDKITRVLQGETVHQNMGGGFQSFYLSPARIGFNDKGNKTLIYIDHELF